MPNRSLILTYHRVVDDGAVATFYDVPLTQFRAHVRQVAATRPAMPVIFTFDDGTADHLRAAEVLADHGLRGVFFLVVNRLGTPGYLRRTDAARLIDLDQIVGSHTVTHPQLPEVTDTALNEELSCSRDVLQELCGRSVDWFAPPGGLYDARTLPAARRTGYRFVRTMDWGYAPELKDQGVGELLPTVPVLRSVSDRRFEKLLAGTATFHAFHLKQKARSLLPPRVYQRLRDWFA
ncbi:MAG: polysaccharide deacetylase family protein [Alphaproteobacteria bacterium]|nr:polysaccharide deacetylase family protein [Alphaproteobacteria bacterium]